MGAYGRAPCSPEACGRGARVHKPDGSPVGPRVNVIIHGAAPETPRFAETVPSISEKRH
jgi:hypothetical protein